LLAKGGLASEAKRFFYFSFKTNDAELLADLGPDRSEEQNHKLGATEA
jgi:hypothetical protein